MDTPINRSEMKRISDATKKANQERADNHSKSQLTRHLETKFRTTMIGALASFEECFGELWGHGKESSALTDEQKVWKERWELARTEVLNKGNNQLRAAKEEVSQYTIRFNKFETKFIIQKDKEE